MMENLGTRAATIQSWSRDAWRVAFNEVKDANPKADEDRLCKLVEEVVLDDPTVLRALIRYGVHNALRSWEDTFEASAEVSARSTRRVTETKTAEQIEERKAEIKAAVKEAASRVLLLNLEMPNGKRMRYCTGTEMAKFGNGYTKIGKHCGRKLVGECLDEQGVRDLMD